MARLYLSRPIRIGSRPRIRRPTLNSSTTASHLMEPTRSVHVSLMHHDPTSTITTTLVGTVGSIGSRRRVLVTRRHGLLSFHFSKALQVDLQRLHVVLEAQSRHRPQKIVAVDRLSLFALALVGGLAGDEADEFRHALLHRLLRVL